MTIVIPRMRIDHKSGKLADGEFSSDRIKCILLGVVRQRRQSDDGRETGCVSPNFEIGFPTEKFDWFGSNFDPKDYPPDQDGLVSLPCASCKFANFGSGVGVNSQAPRCSEQHTYAVMYWPNRAHPDEARITEGARTVLLTFQKSGLKSSRAYMDGLKKKKLAAYTIFTEIRLARQGRDGNYWSVPEFRNVGETLPDNWPLFSASFREVRLEVQSPPTVDEKGKLQISQVQEPRRGAFEGIL